MECPREGFFAASLDSDDSKVIKTWCFGEMGRGAVLEYLLNGSRVKDERVSDLADALAKVNVPMNVQENSFLDVWPS